MLYFSILKAKVMDCGYFHFLNELKFYICIFIIQMVIFFYNFKKYKLNTKT